MLKLYGITNNPPRKRMELKRECVGFKNFRVEKRFLNHKEAQKWESKQPDTYLGEPKADGPFYGYSYEFKKRK